MTPSDWGFGSEGSPTAFIIFELAGVTQSADCLDTGPVASWSGRGNTPAVNGQPSYTPTAAASGGLALSILTEATTSATSQGGPWTGGISNTDAGTYDGLFCYQQAATPGTAMTASWTVAADPDLVGAVVVILPQSAVAAPTVSTGPDRSPTRCRL